jgi:phosphoglycolate phosphatase-like HAD superfamily hydrolase
MNNTMNRFSRISAIISDIEGVSVRKNNNAGEATRRIVEAFGSTYRVSQRIDWKLRRLEGLEEDIDFLRAALAISKRGLDAAKIVENRNASDMVIKIAKETISLEDSKKLTALYNEVYVPFFSFEYKSSIELIGNIGRAIENLRNANVTVSFVSDAKRDTVIEDFKKLGMCDKNITIIAREDLLAERQELGKLLKAIKRTGVRIENSAYVGDTSEDILEAIAAQVMPVGVTSGDGTFWQLRKAGAEWIGRDFSTFAKFLILSKSPHGRYSGT